MKLNDEAKQWLIQQLYKLENLRFTTEEIEYLRTKLPQLTPGYLEYLKECKLD